ncbi:MAG: MFS transporter [Bacteroidaceae bacterium]|nr:MFS transporter [Bacteroidaceae bacterium]
MTSQKQSNLLTLIPVMLCFFAMGFVDLVGTASNFLKADLGLTDSEANLFPSLVFFWFLLFSVPTGMLMNKIGRKKTVLLSLIVTAASLLLPLFGNGYWLMLVSFSLLGIGNTLMQTSLNPLMSLLVSPDKLASNLTFGQFVKAIASFLAPIIAAWGMVHSAATLGLSWRILFPIYLVVGILAALCLMGTKIEEPRQEGKPSTFTECFALLGKPVVLLSFLGIMCHVGIDVGTNTTAPKLLQEIGLPLEEAAWATSLYFIFRTIGCFTGSIILQRIPMRTFFAISAGMIAASMLCMFLGGSAMMLYVGIALVGYGNSNIFSMCFSQALNAMPKKQNEVSGLMIMGLFGGTIFPIAMGLVADAVGAQIGAVAVMAVGALYLLGLTVKITK